MKIALVVALLSTLVVKPVVATDIIATDEKVTLSHVKPSLMAQWIQPEVFGVARVPVDESLSTFKLPGNWVLSPNDSNNSLDVRYYGSSAAENIRFTLAIIYALDKPIPQIEILVKWVAVSEKAYRKFFSPISHANTTLPAILVSGRIDELLKTKQARVLSAPRITTFSGAKGQIISATSFQNVFSEVKNDDGTRKGFAPIGFGQQFDATATLGKNGKITMDVSFFDGYLPPNVKNMAVVVPPRSTVQKLKLQQTSAKFKIQDGETVAVAGQKRNRKLYPNQNERVLYLITARQTHRIDDSTLTDATSSTR